MRDRKPYAIYDKNGRFFYIGLHEDAEDCWRIYLGWPTPSEIADAKARGLQCGIATIQVPRT